MYIFKDNEDNKELCAETKCFITSLERTSPITAKCLLRRLENKPPYKVLHDLTLKLLIAHEDGVTLP